MAAMHSLEEKWKKVFLSVCLWDEGGRRTEGYVLQVHLLLADLGESTPAPAVAHQLRDLGGHNCSPQWKVQVHKGV